ncbi:carbon starvation protein A [bacterium]|nr:carbon starvation protein A [bacterium]
MSALLLVAIGIFLFIISYRFYGNYIEKVFDVDPKRPTPAHYKYDGVDYIPAKHWLVLFGHHFSAIAGAGPILGPAIACAIWGWGPAFLWIIFGSIFIGGVHDFSNLMLSIRNDGRSIGDTAERVLGRTTKLIFSLFLWLSLILVIAVFSASAAKTMETTPQIVIPTFGIIPTAILAGLMLYRWRINTFISTLVGVAILYALILLGFYFPIKWTYQGWLLTLLLIYAYTASILPVNIMLQPRDYLSAFVLFVGLFIGYIGLLLTHPHLRTPMFVSFNSEQGYLFPMMFVTIACGAISGFHALVASGTTAKQLSNEKDARKIGYGAMLTEGALALLAIIAVCGGLYWWGGPQGMIYPELIKEGKWIVAFGKGYSQITRPILGTLGIFIGITMLKTFIVTTLDTATRIARYIGEEIFPQYTGLGFMKNMYLNTLVVIGLATYLALGPWQKLWQIFGTSNQLVAAISLLIISVWLLIRKKSFVFTILPAIFMLTVTLSALLIQLLKFISIHDITLIIISALLILLACFLLIETFKVTLSLQSAKNLKITEFTQGRIPQNPHKTYKEE